MKCSNGFFYVFFKFLGHQNHKEYKDFPIYYCTVHFEVMFILDFRVKQYLKYHMNKHSTVKPFECDVCKKRFKHKKSYEKHMALGRHRKMTDVEHDCDFCDESFASKDLLVDHFAEVHHEENIINTIEDCEGMDVDEEFDNDDDDTKPSLDVKIKKEKLETKEGVKTKVVPTEA